MASSMPKMTPNACGWVVAERAEEGGRIPADPSTVNARYQHRRTRRLPANLNRCDKLVSNDVNPQDRHHEGHVRQCLPH